MKWDRKSESIIIIEKVKTWIDDAPTSFGGLHRLSLSLLALRLVLSTYIAQWGWLHVRYTEAAIDVYDRWYGLTPASILVDEIGIILIAASVLMAAGALRALSYGVCLIFMAAMVVGLIPHLLDPYGYHLPPNWINHGLIAQVPALAGFVAVFVLRREDRFSLDAMAFNKTSRQVSETLPSTPSVAWALFIMRFTCGLFFLQWGIEKFVETEMSVGMLDRWYGVTFAPVLVTWLVGAFEVGLAIALVLGVAPRLTYALGTLVKLKTCIAIFALLAFPFATESGGRLSSVAASVPVLAVLCSLYALRAWDTIRLVRLTPRVQAAE